MSDISTIARHRAHQAEPGRGIRPAPKIWTCSTRWAWGNFVSQSGGAAERTMQVEGVFPRNTGSGGTESETKAFARPFSRSSGTTTPPGAAGAAQRARRRSGPQKMRWTACTWSESADRRSARPATAYSRRPTACR